MMGFASFSAEIFDLERCEGVKILHISKNIMLKNAPTLAIGGVDTAGNRPLKFQDRTTGVQVTNKGRSNIGRCTVARREAQKSEGRV